jgi:hypothetical protein
VQKDVEKWGWLGMARYDENAVKNALVLYEVFPYMQHIFTVLTFCPCYNEFLVVNRSRYVMVPMRALNLYLLYSDSSDNYCPKRAVTVEYQ